MTPAALRAAARPVPVQKTATIPALEDVAQQQLSKELMQNLLSTGLAAAGIGAGARGALGLYNLTRRNLQGSKAKPVGPVAVDVPIPVAEPSKQPRKQADALGWLKNFLRGGEANTQAGIPWSGPAMLAVGAGGLYGGWKGIDHLLDQRRKAQMQQEVQQAREEYNQALLSQYDKPLTAGTLTTKVSAALDELFDTLETLPAEKHAHWNNLGAATNAYLTLATIASALTAKGVYDAVKKRQPGALLAEAQKRRERKLFANQPTQLFANPAVRPAKPQESPQQQLLAAANQTFSE